MDLSSGHIRWTFAGGSSLRPPTVADDTVIWLTADTSSGEGTQGTIHALGLADGGLRWQAPLQGYAAIGGAVVQRGVVFVSTPPSAFDLATGASRWPYGAGRVGDLALGGPVLSADGSVLFVALLNPANDTGRIVALDAAIGQIRSRAELGAEMLRGTERLWLDGDTLIVPTQSGAVLGLEAASGRERWRYRPPSPRLGSVTVADGRVWLVLENAQVVGLDAATGRPAARFRDLNVNLNGQGINQRPAIVNGRLVVAIGRMLLGFPLP
jgi:outer membrane protein assembly factor BamB